MKLSIFTPTHRPTHLMAAFDSLVAQDDPDWEWVVVPNAGAEIPDAIAAHPKVRVVPAPDWVVWLGVGGLKRFACENCTGEYFIELDHDDLLAPGALAAIRKAINDTGAEFIFSDFANFREDGSCEVYGTPFGWESYSVVINGRAYIAMRSFDITPSSMHLIFYAPNHVRVWSKEAYRKAGSHDPNIAVTDDFDLICRTYLSGAKFHHIRECLYLYRLHSDGTNTYVERNAEIQEKQQKVSDKYVYKLIAEWSRRHNLPMYDLGGITNKPDGYLSIDLQKYADVVCDVRDGIPLKESSAGCIRAFDFLEHIPHCADSTCTHGSRPGDRRCVVGVMNDIHRVLVPGGWLITSTPSTEGRGAYQDPTHCSWWNENSFLYYTNQDQRRFVPGITSRFQLPRVWTTHPTEWHREKKIPYVYADLVALKGQRQPGRVYV